MRNGNVLRDTRKLFRLEKKKYIKDEVLIDIRTLFESKEDHYKTLRTGNAFSSNYTEYVVAITLNMKVMEIIDGDKILSIKEYLDCMFLSCHVRVRE